MFFFSLISVTESAIHESEVFERSGTDISSELAFPTCITAISYINKQLRSIDCH